MLARSKWLVAFSLLIMASMVLAACAPEKVVETVIVAGTPQIVEVTPVPEVPVGPIAAAGMEPCKPLPELAYGTAGVASPVSIFTEKRVLASEQKQAEGKVYRVGVFEDVTSTNYFQANGPDNTVWNAYMLPERLMLYGLSEKTFVFYPVAAKDMPAPLTEENGKWVVSIPIRDDITWSDGTPFTANDVAFTAETILKFGLISGNWQQWYDSNYLEKIEAVDDYTAKVIYHTKPGLARHEMGVLQGPVLSKSFWEAKVAEAAAPIDALAAGATDEEKAAAQAEATDLLYALDATGEPTAGSYVITKWEKAAFLENAARPEYFLKGTKETFYANGAYQEVQGDRTFVVNGAAEGDKVLELTVGPFVDKVIYTYYGSQDAAILALQDGVVDFIINPLGLQRGLSQRIQGDPNLTVTNNNVNGFRYLSFNVRRQPMNYCSFRQAMAVLIDKEFVTGTILQNVAFPLYTFVPEANAAWYYSDVPKLGQGLDREQRVNLAVAILEQDGFTWKDDQKPVWNADNIRVEGAGRLIMPDGTPVPELNMLAPSPGYDPLRSTFAIWIESWANEMGIPVKANLAGFNILIPLIFTEQDFDMYILGWSLSVFPSYMRDFWHSEQAVADGNNAGGYASPEFDKLSTEMLTCGSIADCKKISDQLQTMLATEVPYVVLFDTGIIEAYRSAAVSYPYTEVLSGLQFMHQQPQAPMQSRVSVK